ncbi:MAG TPA: type IV toxin-antitoxin system AbiEi family antitoxin domain-containing protein [Propionicimonas sp.]
MIPRRLLSEELLGLAERQAGALSTTQLEAFGITGRVVERLLAQGSLTRITRGVYATVPGGWMQLAWTGVLIGGAKAVLGGRAAAFLHGVLPNPPDRIEVFAGSQHRVRDPRWHLSRVHRLGYGEPPRTRAAQTVVDVTADLTADETVAVLAEAIGRRGVRSRELQLLLAERARHPHRRLLLELITEVGAGAQSPLEVRYVREVERAHGLPAADRQASPLSGRRADGWYPDFGLVIELDGRAFHSGANALNDMDRDNAHLVVGVATLRFGWRQVTQNPCGVARIVAASLHGRGWQGATTTCPRCHANNR